MKGLELSEKFYFECAEPILKKDFPDVFPNLAAALTGSGSECFGFDDEISQDHDFEPGFCLFLPDEDLVDRKTAFKLERFYSALPKEFEGFKRNKISPVGGNRHGVIRISDFLMSKVGNPTGKISMQDWLTIPDSFLAEATNGKVFYDGAKILTDAREYLNNMPEDIFLKKLAGNLITMAQSGQYNYLRCLSHNESAASQLAVYEFSESAMKTVFLLNRKYMPYYKWSFKAMRNLPKLSSLADTLEFLISSDNEEENAKLKYEIIEDISRIIIDEIKTLGISKATCLSLEKHAYSVNDFIKDEALRNLSIFAAV